MMTNGPEATVGQILDVPFQRPRQRQDVLDDPHYYDFRFALIAFLEKQEHAKESHVAAVKERLNSPEEAKADPKTKSKAETKTETEKVSV